MNQQKKAPLLEALLAYGKQPLWPFHTPGHKQGKGLDSELKELLQDFASADVSLMGDELDDPFAPSSCIAKSQQLLAELYGAEDSYFSAIGTTGALQILMLASLKEGDKVLLPRNAHRSIFGGLVLTGANPVLLQPEWDSEWGISHGISAETLNTALAEHPDAKVLILISPTYYGTTGDLKQLIAMAHERNLTVLVDEAHGPHLSFFTSNLSTALQSGADGIAQSAHKLLGAFTGASWLHLSGDRINRERIRQAFLVLQTSSPNYPLLASLDGARRQMGVRGKELWEIAARQANEIRREINNIEGLTCLTESDAPFGKLDPCKLTVGVQKLGLTGIEAGEWLRWQENIQPELVDEQNVLFIWTYADGEPEKEALLSGLRRLAQSHLKKTKPINQVALLGNKKSAPLARAPRQVFFAEKKNCLLNDSVGKIAGEMISFYPPGIPLIWPGERIELETLEIVKKGLALGLMVAGPQDLSLNNIQVVEEPEE